MSAFLHYFPAALVLLAAYMVFLRFTVKSVLTAVVCDRMNSVSDANTETEREEEQEKLLHRKRCKLGELYDSVDINASGSIDRNEFNQLLWDEDKSDDLCYFSDMDELELPWLWGALAKGERVIDQNGHKLEVETILREDFIEGLVEKQANLKEFSLLRLEKRMAIMERHMVKIAEATTFACDSTPRSKGQLLRPINVDEWQLQ